MANCSILMAVLFHTNGNRLALCLVHVFLVQVSFFNHYVRIQPEWAKETQTHALRGKRGRRGRMRYAFYGQLLVPRDRTLSYTLRRYSFKFHFTIIRAKTTLSHW